jgi:hypothetical protein
VVEEEFRFQNLADFTPKKSYSEIRLFAAAKHGAGAVQQNCSSAKTNKILRNMLENDQTRAAFVEVLKEVAQELEK